MADDKSVLRQEIRREGCNHLLAFASEDGIDFYDADCKVHVIVGIEMLRAILAECEAKRKIKVMV